jgi:hypothetical protein
LTNKDIWDFIIEIFRSEKSTSINIFSSHDDYFKCTFDYDNNFVYFKIKVINSFFSENTYEISNITSLLNRNITEKELKNMLVPLIRQSKLEMIGV